MSKTPQTDGRRRFLNVSFVTIMAAILLVIMLVVPVTCPWSCISQGRRSAAQAELAALTGALKQYRLVFGEYPPDASQDSRFDTSSECLIYYLGTSFAIRPNVLTDVRADRDAGPFMVSDASKLGDTDGDGLMEILDPWGVPYCYDNLADDAAGYTDCGHAECRKLREDKAWHPESFDLWSRNLGEPTE